MEIVLVSTAFLVAMLCAGTMGFAIQRGATCTVAAVQEVVTQRRFGRLAALLEAALWVAGGLLVAQALHVLPKMPAGYAVGAWTVIGGALLGFGAFVNRACVFGAIARFGSGEWAYIVTPLGFYIGCVSVDAVFGAPSPHALPYGSPVLQASAGLALLFVALAAWRIGRPFVAGVRSGRLGATLAARAWSPHTATSIIGVTFVVLLLLVGAWAYTDVLVELARGMAGSLAARFLLLVALLAGAAWGGWTAGHFHNTRIEGRQVARCFAGGVLMGWGSVLIPGGNDGLILVAMPLLWAYAWVAFATMCITIAAAMLLAGRLGPALGGRRRRAG